MREPVANEAAVYPPGRRYDELFDHPRLTADEYREWLIGVAYREWLRRWKPTMPAQ